MGCHQSAPRFLDDDNITGQGVIHDCKVSLDSDLLRLAPKANDPRSSFPSREAVVSPSAPGAPATPQRRAFHTASTLLARHHPGRLAPAAFAPPPIRELPRVPLLHESAPRQTSASQPASPRRLRKPLRTASSPRPRLPPRECREPAPSLPFPIALPMPAPRHPPSMPNHRAASARPRTALPCVCPCHASAHPEGAHVSAPPPFFHVGPREPTAQCEAAPAPVFAGHAGTHALSRALLAARWCRTSSVVARHPAASSLPPDIYSLTFSGFPSQVDKSGRRKEETRPLKVDRVHLL
ncbi:hypothetical protein Taro_004170 [Colocasia esculenta]|uniref:Uncharacterized protein n=1 Tax=Colocasia esculenta TaxID=4460 RepID=A0A843TLA9_COLES|nr:hypothetical protein [Colocasia esculenta]